MRREESAGGGRKSAPIGEFKELIGKGFSGWQLAIPFKATISWAGFGRKSPKENEFLQRIPCPVAHRLGGVGVAGRPATARTPSQYCRPGQAVQRPFVAVQSSQNFTRLSGTAPSASFPLFLFNSQQEVTRTNFLWLKLHLTVVDLLVIACYCPSHIAWLIGYTWSAGTFLCKAMQYSWSVSPSRFSFIASSLSLPI